MLIVPLTLAVVLGILAALLRALVAPRLQHLPHGAGARGGAPPRGA
jgi:hypothetical protein